MKQRAKPDAPPALRRIMSTRPTRIAIGALAAVALLAGGWWAYFKFTTIPPPDLAVAKSDEVASFLGSERGFARMSVDDRQEYLAQTCQRFGQGQDRVEFVQALDRMSDREQKVFLDAFFEVGRTRVVQHAEVFNKLRSPREKKQFVDHAIRTLDGITRSLNGSAVGPAPGLVSAPMPGAPDGPVPSIGEPFKRHLPRGGDELMKEVVNRTTAKDRADAKPFIDAMAARYKELRDSGQLEQFLRSAAPSMGG